MFNKFFVSCFTILALFTIGTYFGYSHDNYDVPDDAEVYVDVHGDVADYIFGDKISVHVHGIVYVANDADLNSDGAGNYTISLTVSEPENEKKKWGRENYGSDINLQNSFLHGVLVEDDISFSIKPRIKAGNSIKNIGWSASTTVELRKSIGDPLIARDYDEKPLGQDDENEDWEDDDTTAPSPGLYAVNATTITINGEQMVDTMPGDTVSVNLVMPLDKGYSQIFWYLAGPNDLGYGNGVGGPTSPSGSGIETEVTHTFSMPSDASGVYTFTAYIYPHSSASDQTCYEYTIKIYCS